MARTKTHQVGRFTIKPMEGTTSWWEVWREGEIVKNAQGLPTAKVWAIQQTDAEMFPVDSPVSGDA